jgi:hypothetical protein
MFQSVNNDGRVSGSYTARGDHIDECDSINDPTASATSSLAALEDQSTTQRTEGDLLYLNILNDTVSSARGIRQHHALVNTSHPSRIEESYTPQNCFTIRLPHLDVTDNKYLLDKGVFDLPPQGQL